MKRGSNHACTQHVCWSVVIAVCVMLAAGAPAFAQATKFVNAESNDWCFGQPSVSRIENSSATLSCKSCTGSVNEACFVASDCPSNQPCTGATRTETLWWDERTDGAVNDLATVALASDNSNLYIYAELWVDPDPVSLPFGHLLIDYKPGGSNDLLDPGASTPPGLPPGTYDSPTIRAPGVCSNSVDRACTNEYGNSLEPGYPFDGNSDNTGDADCHFCVDSFEPPSQCCKLGTCPNETCRLRTKGSGCDPGDSFTTEFCLGVGTSATNDTGVDSDPQEQADYLIQFDFSIWLVSGGTIPSARLNEWTGASWSQVNDFSPFVDPGSSGGSGGPPGAVEMAIPWSEFGCTGCPAACSCPGLGPNSDYTYTLVISRGQSGLDFVPRGQVEDVFSETTAGRYTRGTDNCPGSGIGTTQCEIADGSTDTFIPVGLTGPAGGRVRGLTVDKAGGTMLDLAWGPSCTLGDNDYEIYEGTIGSWYSHNQINCSTGGLTATISPAAGSSYYLIVPTDGSDEGSYGRRSSGVERPVGGAVCHAQTINGCP